MNWYKQQALRLKKIAAKATDINELEAWIQSEAHDPAQLRLILGRLSKDLNDASYIFKMGVRSPNPEISNRAAEIFPNIANIQRLHSLLANAEQVFTSTNNNSPLFAFCTNLIHMLQHMNFTPQQVEQLRLIAVGNSHSQSDYADEVNSERMNAFLKSSIYSAKDDSSKSLRVIREILQNSADAVMKQRGITPDSPVQINIWTHDHNDNTMDLMVQDTGTGMNWELLSQKFFVYFASGKQADQDAAGGFGIAKALIQETPQEGWSIDTNGVHSSRFHKNVFMGTPKSQNYQVPQSRIQHTGNGTIITLFRIPSISYGYDIETLAKKYGTNGILQISVNGQIVKPEFLLSELKSVDSVESFKETLGKNDTEKEIIDDLYYTQAGDLPNHLGKMNFQEDGTQTTVEFFMRPTSYTGKFYLFLNNQYQFDNDYIPKADIICSVKTTARPGTDVYPVDPGRENLREPYKTQVETTKKEMMEFLKKISESDLFKQGLNIFMFNKDAAPMSYNESETRQSAKSIATNKAIEKAWSSVVGTGLFSGEEKSEEETEQAVNGFIKQVEDSIQVELQQEFGAGGGVPGQETPQQGLDQQQRAILKAAIESAIEERDEKYDVHEKIKEVIEGINTPCIISIQKDFISGQMAHEQTDLTANMILLWQKALKIIIDKVGNSSIKWKAESREFVPGLVFTNEALALYMPPQGNTKFHGILVNPITIASIVEPDLFEKILEENKEDSGFQDSQSNDIRSETPTNKLAVFIFHTAVHELVHLLFPDSWGHENFHIYISKLETMCHFEFPKIRDETKKHMRSIRRDSQKLIRAIARDKRNRMKKKN